MKINRERLKQIIKEELEALALEGEEEEEQSPERKRGERLKSKLFKDRSDTEYSSSETALGGRTLQPGERGTVAPGLSDAARKKALGVTSYEEDEQSQDAGLYMSRGDFNPASDEGDVIGMFSPEEMAASKLAKKDYGKDIPDYMRAGYKGDAPKTRLRDTETDEEREARLGGRFKGTKFIPTRSRKGGGNLAAAKKAMRAARALVKAELAKPENKGKSIYDLDKSKGSPRAKFASAYKALKRAKAGRGASRVAKKTLPPLPKLRTRPPGLPDSRSPAAKQRMADGTPLTGPKTGGPLSPEERRAAAGNVDYFKKPAKSTRKRPSIMTASEKTLKATRAELAAGKSPTDPDMKALFDRQVAKLKRENPGQEANIYDSARERVLRMTNRRMRSIARKRKFLKGKGARALASPELLPND